MEKSQLLKDIKLRERHSVKQQDFNEFNRKKDNRVRKCNFQWTSEATMILIENVEKFGNLWNPYDGSYKDRKMHQKSWDRIAKSLSLPKEEVVIKWNSLRSNYRIYQKNQRAEKRSQRRPHPFFVAMAFLDPVLKINKNNHESNLVGNSEEKNENSNITFSEGYSCPTSLFTDQDNIAMKIACDDPNSSVTAEFKEKIPSEDNFASVSHNEENNSQQKSKPPILLHKRICRKRKIRRMFDVDNENQEQAEEDLETLQKTKLRLEIYNLQLDAVKKEIELGLERSQFTAKLYENWDVSTKEEI